MAFFICWKKRNTGLGNSKYKKTFFLLRWKALASNVSYLFYNFDQMICSLKFPDKSSKRGSLDTFMNKNIYTGEQGECK